MLRLFEGGFTSNIHAELIRAVESAIASGSRVYLIVPEQQTVAAECEMSRILPPTAPLSFEVTNFTRFTNTAFRAIGGISGEYSTPVAKALTMWRTLSSLSGQLAMMRKAASVSAGTVAKAMSAVSEMQALGIAPEEISAVASEQGYDRRLSEKLSDLALIYGTYTKALSEKYVDSANDASVLADKLCNDPDFLMGTEVFIDGFTSFTETQYKLIGEMMKNIPVSVTLTQGGGFEFAEVEKAKGRLIRIARESSVDKKLVRCRGLDLGKSPVIGEIASLLWRSEGKIDNESLQELEQDGGRVKIFSAPTAYEECNFVAEDIKRRVMLGAKYSDFAIVARRIESYIGILDFSLEGAGVPYFLSKPTDVGASPAVKLIMTAYRIVTAGFKRDDVLTYMKCGLSDLSDEERDGLEAYVEKWSIDGRRFTDGITWNMNPRGYTDMTEEDAERLVKIDGARRKLIEPLCVFRDDVKAAKTVREHAKALISHLCTLRLEDALLDRANRLRALGEIAAADESASIWSVICDALDSVVDILEDTPSNAESFVNQLAVAVAAAPIGRIPAHRDEVTVGAADMLRVRDKKHVYLIGVNTGEFPSSVSEGTFFTERDRVRLADRLPIEPDLSIKNARELYSFSRSFASAGSTVTLLYAEKTAMLDQLKPSDVIKRIKEITSNKVTPIKLTELDGTDSLYSPTITLEALGTLGEEEIKAATAALERSGCADKLRISEGRIKNTSIILGDDSLAMLYRGDLYLSQTKINSFLSCPMSYFLKYNLGLDTAEPAELGSNVIGSFVHGVIEGFFREAKRMGRGISSLTDAEREELTNRCAERYMTELMGSSEPDGRTRVAISRLTRATRPVIDGLCEEFSACKYEPMFFELETSNSKSELPNHLLLHTDDSERILVKAKIDRVDTYRHGNDVYVRVVDYKTGSNTFLPSKLAEGEHMQMFLYLRAVTESDCAGFKKRLGVGEGGKVIPAGVIYVKASVADKTISSGDDDEARAALREMQKRDGMILDDSISIDAMNPDFLPPKAGPRSTKFESREYTVDGWREISDTIGSIVMDVARGMKSGRLEATPASHGSKNCNWCKFKEICRGAIVKESW